MLVNGLQLVYIMRPAINGLSANDMKAINTSAQQCGHVQDIKLMIAGHLVFEAKCIPAMQMCCTYKLSLLLDKDKLDAEQAECRRPAGQKPFVNMLLLCAMLLKNLVALEEYQNY